MAHPPGIELDANLMGVALDLGVKLDEMAGESREMRRAMANMLAGPRTVGGVQTITAAATQTVVNLGGPVSGRDWEFRRLTFAPPIGVAGPVAQGVLILNRSGQIEVQRAGTGANVNVPGVFVYGKSQLMVRYPDTVWVAWSGGTVGAQLVLDWQAAEGPSSSDFDPQAGELVPWPQTGSVPVDQPLGSQPLSLIFTASITASGGTTLYTPTGFKRFWLAGYQIWVSGNASKAAAVLTQLTLQDGAGGSNIGGMQIFMPAAAGAAFGNDQTSGWVNLPGGGYKSSGIGQFLTFNMSGGVLTTGNISLSYAMYPDQP